MSVMNLPRLLLLVAALLFSHVGVLQATDASLFESCTDGRGRTLKAVGDSQQSVLVRSVVESGVPTIHYRSDLLPRLSQNARLFFYLHECARVGLGDPTGGRVPERVRLADCKGLDALLASGVFKRSEIPALQAELSFSEQEWALLPGLPRNFDLARCVGQRGNVLSLPPGVPPSARQTGWNDCVRACADRLWTCQKTSCSGAGCASCTGAYEACNTACGPSPEVGRR